MNAATRALAAAAVLIGVLAGGCSNGSPDNGDADAADGAAGTAEVRATGVRFAECMRANGVTGFPDPDASGEVTIDGVVNGSNIDPDGPVWTAAIQACEDLQPAGFTGGERTPEEQAAALAFAQCMRDNGVPDFPDPVDGEPLVNTYNIPSSDTEEGMAALNAAMDACGDIVADQLRSEP